MYIKREHTIAPCQGRSQNSRYIFIFFCEKKEKILDDDLWVTLSNVANCYKGLQLPTSGGDFLSNALHIGYETPSSSFTAPLRLGMDVHTLCTVNTYIALHNIPITSTIFSQFTFKLC